MNHGLNPGLLIALALVAALIGGSYWLARKQERKSLRRSEPSRGNRRPAGHAGRSGVLSAAQVEAEATRLLASNASWPQITQSFNPSNDSQISAELQRIRGPHMFAPATAINVIKHGCEEVLRASPHASALSAIKAARVSMEKVTRYGD